MPEEETRRKGRVPLTMTERVDDVDALGRVEGQAPFEQVDRKRVRVRVQGLERFLLLVRQRAQVVAAALRPDRVKILQRRRTEDPEDQRELVMVCLSPNAALQGQLCFGGGTRSLFQDDRRRTISAREERLSVEHFCENAADRPYGDAQGISRRPPRDTVRSETE